MGGGGGGGVSEWKSFRQRKEEESEQKAEVRKGHCNKGIYVTVLPWAAALLVPKPTSAFRLPTKLPPEMKTFKTREDVALS